MANEEQFVRLKASSAENNYCAAWNQWRREDDWQTKIELIHADLSGINLSRVDLRGAALIDAYLSGAILNGAIFRSADLTHATLTGIYLSDADLTDANLTDADVRGADLRGVALWGANLSNAHLNDTRLTGAYLMNATLTGANFTNVIVGITQFDRVDLRQITGLASIQHQGPSTIGIDTLYKSEGAISEAFLRGCGVPDTMIEFAHALVHAENPIDYYSAFISYNHEDEAFATRLYNDLQANNVRCWKYTEDVKIGDEIERTVDQAIRLHDKLLVIFSAHSVASDWVADEVERVIKREEQEQKTVLFPVKIDDAINQADYGWARKVRRHRNIGDFTGWEQQPQYQPMFDRLLRDLKADSR